MLRDRGNIVTKPEMIEAIQRLAEKLGRQPTLGEFRRHFQISWRVIARNFTSWREALREAGLAPGNQGTRLPLDDLVRDWLAVVRKLGKVPTDSEYSEVSKYSTGPLTSRFGGWRNVPAGILQYMVREDITEEWRDVFEMVSAYQERRIAVGLASGPSPVSNSSPRAKPGRPIYGPPTFDGPLAHLPTNEAGVIFLFATVARDLGFRVMRIQSEFPDAEVMREVGPDQWQRWLVEFEFESRNYLKHGHPLTGCDLIVCWVHNWPGCPIEVIELKQALSNQHSVFRPLQAMDK